MSKCNQPIPCSTFNNDGSIFAYSVIFSPLFWTNVRMSNRILSLLNMSPNLCCRFAMTGTRVQEIIILLLQRHRFSSTCHRYIQRHFNSFINWSLKNFEHSKVSAISAAGCWCKTQAKTCWKKVKLALNNLKVDPILWPLFVYAKTS